MTISSDRIEKILRWLEERYDAAENTEIKETKIYSKMAILELSGWVEESMDAIVWDLVGEKLEDKHEKRRFRKFVDSVSGFTYEKHFLKLLHKAIGIMNREVVERRIDNSILSKFRVALKNLAKSRDHLAHTFSQGTQEYIDSPSTARTYYKDILLGLQAFAKEVANNQNLHSSLGGGADVMQAGDAP